MFSPDLFLVVSRDVLAPSKKRKTVEETEYCSPYLLSYAGGGKLIEGGEHSLIRKAARVVVRRHYSEQTYTIPPHRLVKKLLAY